MTKILSFCLLTASLLTAPSGLAEQRKSCDELKSAIEATLNGKGR
jgi:hypothetical protein